MKTILHFVGLCGDTLRRTTKIFGLPDMVHRFLDPRASAEFAKSSIELEYIKDVRNSDTGNKYKVGESASHITVACVYKVTRTMKILGREQPVLNYKLGDILDEEEVETLRRASQFIVTIT